MKALIVVDMQNDFMPGGALPVTGADLIIAPINTLMGQFPFVIATKDWHPADHVSFAVNHPGKKVGDNIIVDDISQILWPVHCVQNTEGAESASGLDVSRFSITIRKGGDQNVDSYSAFFDNARRKETELLGFLKKEKVTELYFVGVAAEYCVLHSVLDALDLGFTTYVILDACRGIGSKEGDIERSYKAMAASGAQLITILDAMRIGP